MQVLAQGGFDPQPPGNPGANYWYSEKGEVVVDDFKPGRLDAAISAAIGDADPKDVLSIRKFRFSSRKCFCKKAT